MNDVTFQNDSPKILVRGNDIDDIIRLLRYQTKGTSAFTQSRVPRKNMRRRQRRMEKSLRAQRAKRL